MEKEEKIQQMLQVLAQAKTWPADLLQGVVEGRDMDAEIKDVQEKILHIEGQARALIQSMGCTDPRSQTLSRATADMMINWYHFHDQELPRALRQRG